MNKILANHINPIVTGEVAIITRARPLAAQVIKWAAII